MSVICENCALEVPDSFVCIVDNKSICIKCLRLERLFQCGHCNAPSPLANKVYLDNMDICLTCANAHYIKCNACSMRCDAEAIKDVGGYKYCLTCYTAKFTSCAVCAKVCQKRDMKTVDDEHYCNTCYQDLYATCRLCGNTFLREDMLHTDGRWSCATCNPRNEIMDAGYKPTPVFFGKESMLFMGVELEVECKKVQKTVDAIDMTEEFYLKTDGSLSEKGIELVSMPCTLDYHKNNIKWEERCKRMVGAGTKSHQTDTCGLHVHISSDRMSNIERMKLSWFFHKEIEPIRSISRRKVPFGRDARDPAERLKIIKTTKNYRNEGRYDYLNWHNPHTVEFRLPKGTLNAGTLIGTLELCDGAVEYTKACTINEIRNGSFDKFLMWCQGSKRNRARYSNLIAFFVKREKCPVLAALKKSAIARAAHFHILEEEEIGLVAGPVIDADEVEDPRFARV